MAGAVQIASLFCFVLLVGDDPKHVLGLLPTLGVPDRSDPSFLAVAGKSPESRLVFDPTSGLRWGLKGRDAVAAGITDPDGDQDEQEERGEGTRHGEIVGAGANGAMGLAERVPGSPADRTSSQRTGNSPEWRNISPPFGQEGDNCRDNTSILSTINRRTLAEALIQLEPLRLGTPTTPMSVNRG